MTAHKTNDWLRCILLVLLILCIPLNARVEATNVLDCLENEDNCDEEKTEEVLEDQEKDSEEPLLIGEQTMTTPGIFFNIIKIVIALLLVLSLIYLVLLFLRKRNRMMGNDGVLDNLGGISLGQNRSIQIVKIGNRIYAVGVGEQVDLMFEITDDDVIESLLMKKQEEANLPFLDHFFKKTEKGSGESKAFLLHLNKELEKLRWNRDKLVQESVKKEKDDDDV